MKTSGEREEEAYKEDLEYLDMLGFVKTSGEKYPWIGGSSLKLWLLIMKFISIVDLSPVLVLISKL